MVCCGAKPLLFLDYIACGKNVPERIADIVKGVSEGCVQAGCALVGGETAEMPGFYPEDEYDLAGFSVGVVDREKILDRERVQAGDVLIALPSSGLHSNGFSLVRRVFDVEKRDLSAYSEELGMRVGEALLTPTRIYVKPILALMEKAQVRSVCHITGGGFYENIPRALPSGLTARIAKKNVQTPPIFAMLAKLGGIPERDMFNTFNMGVGMCAIVPQTEADEAVRALRAAGESAYILGEVVPGDEGVELA